MAGWSTSLVSWGSVHHGWFECSRKVNSRLPPFYCWDWLVACACSAIGRMHWEVQGTLWDIEEKKANKLADQPLQPSWLHPNLVARILILVLFISYIHTHTHTHYNDMQWCIQWLYHARINQNHECCSFIPHIIIVKMKWKENGGVLEQGYMSIKCLLVSLWLMHVHRSFFQTASAQNPLWFSHVKNWRSKRMNHAIECIRMSHSEGVVDVYLKT